MRRINLGPTNKKTQATWIQWITDALRNIERWINTITAFKGATASADGSDGIVPQPRAGDQTKFLKADGTWATPAGAGNVTKVGTPVDNQIGVWTGDGTIEGDTDLTFDTATNTLASGIVTVTDDPYDATGWNGSTAVPTKNALRDKIETLGTISGSSGSTDNALIRADGTGGATIQGSGATATLGDDGALVLASNTAITNLTLTSTDAGATGPTIKIYHNSASPAANDLIGTVTFTGKDSGGVDTDYGKIVAKAEAVTGGSEKSSLTFYVTTEGSDEALLTLSRTNGISLIGSHGVSLTGDVWQIIEGGTGAQTPSGARASLELSSADSPEFTAVNIGHATDTTLTRVSAGVISVEGNTIYHATGTDVALADGGTGASLADPGADRIMFWDDSAGAVDWLTIGTNLTITGTTLDATAGSATAASQAEQEAGSSTTVFTTPGRQHFHPGHPKCWAFWTVSAGTPTLESSYNITSIADTAVGRVTVTIATDFSSANWLPVPSTATNSTGDGGGDFCAYASIAAGSVEIQSRNLVGATDPDQSLADNASYGFAGFGDHA